MQRLKSFGDAVFQALPLIPSAMEAEDVLVELAPDLLGGIGPRGRGRQAQQLNATVVPL